MDFFEYFRWMFTANTPSSYVALGILGFFLISILSEMLAGYKRGVGRQLVHVAFTAVAFVVSFFLTQYLLTQIHSVFESYTIEELTQSLAGGPIDEDASAVLKMIDESAGNLPELILTLPAATLIAPIAFTVFFYAVNLLLKIICFIATRFVKKGETAAPKLLGMLTGAAEGLLVAALVLVPVVAVSDILDSSYAELEESAAELPAEVDRLYTDYVKPVGEHPLLAITRAVGGDAIINGFARIDIGSGEIDMREEIRSAVHIIGGASGLTEVDWSKLEANDKELISSMIDGISSSEYFSELFVCLFGLFADAYEKDGSNALVADGSGDLLSSLLNDVVVILGNTTKETLSEDLNTFKDMFFTLSDGDVLAAFDEGLDRDGMLAVLNGEDENGKTVISKLLDTLRANERTAPLVTTLTKLSVSIMAEQMGLGEEAEAIYEGVKEGLGGIADIDRESYSTEEEYKSAVKDSLSDTLRSNGITLDDEVVGEMADYAAENYGELETLSEQDINDILLKYYEASMAE